MAMFSQDSAHLLRRVGFQPTPKEVEALGGASLSDAAARIVDQARAPAALVVAPPGWAEDPIDERFIPKGLKGEERKTFKRENEGRRNVELQEWWLREMMATRQPLRERMTLFWHGHFVSSIRKVEWGQLMFRQNQLFRMHALGNYRELLKAVSRDPAMLIYLDNRLNVVGKPNENYARELMELFTLGEGHYSEKDIQESARAFSGWNFAPPDGRFVVEDKRHDNGDKQFLGKRGNFDGDDIIDIILEQPRAAEFLVEKLWREFVSPTPDASEVKRLAAGFRRDYELAPLMRALLASSVFVAPANRGSMIKSPIEFVVGTVRLFALPLDPSIAVLAADSMGQALFNAPNVKGWPTGEDWITTQSLLARRQFLEFLVGDATEFSPQLGTSPAFSRRTTKEIRRDQRGIADAVGSFASEATVEGLQPIILPLPPLEQREGALKPSEQLEGWLLDLVYNLK